MGIKIFYIINVVVAGAASWAFTFAGIIYMGFFVRKELFPPDAWITALFVAPILFVLASPFVVWLASSYLTQHPKTMFFAPWVTSVIVLLLTTVAAFRSGSGVLLLIVLVWPISIFMLYFIFAKISTRLLEINI